MNRPELYSQVNKIQRRDAQEVLEEFADTIKWRLDGNDFILDAGCGSGDVTVDILLPILPKNFQRLVGVDISKQMVEYARKTQIHPKLSFEQFDLCTDLEKQPLNWAKSFDHIFSFYTFHRVPDKKMCLKNFHKLLGANGDLLLLFAGNHPIYDAYKEQSINEKWTSYMIDVDKITPSYQHSKNAAKEFYELLTECGFTDCDVRVNEKNFIFENIDVLRDFLHAVNPFIDRLAVEDKETYLDDLVGKLIQKFKSPVEINYEGNTIAIPYKSIVAYARKKF